MLFSYKIVTKEGRETVGDIEALNQDVAVNSLQRSGAVVVSIGPVAKKNFFEYDINIFSRITLKDIAISSRQIATLLEAHVPALKTFRLLAAESEKPVLRSKFAEIADDIQNGVSISDALYKHPSAFSDFYVNMVRGGEESGKLSETFLSLADYLERTYEILAKARGALIYPIFVLSTFVVVMILMLTLVIPKLSEIIIASGQDMPFYTIAVIGMSSFLINYGALVLVIIILALLIIWKYIRGTNILARAKLQLPAIGNLYQTLYLSRISDNMHTMLTNGISMVRAVEITASVVDNPIYKQILTETVGAIKGGVPLSVALSGRVEIPSIMIQMIKVGEETGELGGILGKLTVFYQREVTNAINTIVSLIEPVMIVLLGIGVGGVLAAVLVPIYQIAGNT